MPEALTQKEKDYVEQALKAGEGPATIIQCVLIYRVANNIVTHGMGSIYTQDPIEVQKDLTEIRVGIQQVFRALGQTSSDMISPSDDIRKN